MPRARGFVVVDLAGFVLGWREVAERRVQTSPVVEDEGMTWTSIVDSFEGATSFLVEQDTSLRRWSAVEEPDVEIRRDRW